MECQIYFLFLFLCVFITQDECVKRNLIKRMDPSLLLLSDSLPEMIDGNNKD